MADGRQPAPREAARPADGMPAVAGTVAALLCTAVFLLCLALYYATAHPLSTEFAREQAALLGIFDSRGQSLAHKATLISALLLVVAAMFPARKKGTVAPSWLSRAAGYAAVAAGPLLLCAALIDGLAQRRFLYLGLVAFSYAIFALYIMARRRSGKTLRSIVIGTVAAASCAIVLSGLFTPPLYGTRQLLIDSNSHYSFVMTPADRLAAGIAPYSMAQAKYGILPAALLAAYEKGAGFLDFGGHVKLAQVSQLLFFILAVLALYKWRPKQWPYLALMMLFMCGWLSASGKGSYIPNQSGWRSIGLPLGMLVLLYSAGLQTALRALVLGMASAVLFLLNPETGLVMTGGFILFQVFDFKDPGPRRVAAAAAAFIAGAAAAAGAFYLFFTAAFGMPEGGRSGGLFFDFIGRFSGGFAGLKLKFNPFAAVLLVHGLYTVSSGAAAFASGGPDRDRAVRVTAAAVILVWLSYYVNRPDTWNLWTFTFLYAFLAADLPGRAADEAKAGPAGFAGINAVILCAVIIPMALSAAGIAARDSAAYYRGINSGGYRQVSGVLVPEKTAQELLAKRDAILSRENGSKDYLFFTSYSAMLPLELKNFNATPFNDIYLESYTEADMRANAALLASSGAGTVYFDSYAGEREGSDRFTGAFYDRLKPMISDAYSLKATEHGLEVWERRR